MLWLEKLGSELVLAKTYFLNIFLHVGKRELDIKLVPFKILYNEMIQMLFSVSIENQTTACHISYKPVCYAI